MGPKIIKIILMICSGLVLFSPLFLLVGCDNGYVTAKEFLFQHPAIKLQLNKGDIFDKYTPEPFFKALNKENEILIIHIGDEKYEVLLKDEEQRIGDTAYLVRSNCF